MQFNHVNKTNMFLGSSIDNIKIDTADNPLKATITSDSVWGILRGMETLSQLVYSSAETGVAVR